MSLHRFFTDTSGLERKNDGVVQTATFSGEEAVHAARVLRLDIGAEIVVCDGTGMEYLGKLEHVSPKVCRVVVSAQRLCPAEPTVSVCLFQALAKGEKMDWIVQKSTELGVAGIIPVITEHCVVKLKDEKKEARTDRWERIAREAAKQCGRAVVPRIHPVMDLVSTLSNVDVQRVLVPWEGASEPLHTVLHDWRSRADNLHSLPDQHSDFKQITGDAATMRADGYALGVVIGPEGGISGDEVQALLLQGAKPVTLGPRILRTETAAIATLTAVLFAYNEFGGGRSMNEWR